VAKLMPDEESGLALWTPPDVRFSKSGARSPDPRRSVSVDVRAGQRSPSDEVSQQARFGIGEGLEEADVGGSLIPRRPDSSSAISFATRVAWEMRASDSWIRLTVAFAPRICQYKATAVTNSATTGRRNTAAECY